MLASVANWVLRYFLGKYVDNLDSQQLNIALLQGELELDNLPLNREALRQIGFPVELQEGFIGKVKLQIPLRAIRTEPWVIIISQLYLVAGPININEWDIDAEEQALLEQKLSFLDALESQWRASLEGLDQGYYAASYLSWMNFGTSVLSTIIENLQFVGPAIKKMIREMSTGKTEFKWQLKITDVHIRYEDKLTIPGQCFTFGIVLGGFVEQSNSDTNESSVSTLKVFQLSNLSVYWQDCTDEEFVPTGNTIDFTKFMGDDVNKGKQFIINHVSGTVNIRKNRSAQPLRSKETPRIICDILFDNFTITITDNQYFQLCKWQKGLKEIELQMKLALLQRKFKIHRPACSAKDDPRGWWHYVTRAIILGQSSSKSEVRTWPDAVQRAKNISNYVKIYERLLLNAAAVLADDETLFKNELEQELGVEELRDLRIVAMTRVYRAMGKSRANSKSTIFSWFPQFWASSSAQEENPEVTSAEQLLKTDDDATFLKRDMVFAQFNFTLQKGSIHLATVDEDVSDVRSVMELKLEKVVVGFESRPRTSSYKVTLALGDILLTDKFTKDSSLDLIRPQSNDTSTSTDTSRKQGFQWPSSLTRLLQGMSFVNEPPLSDRSLFSLVYEFKPFDSHIDQRLHVKMDSLDIIYKAEIVRFLSDFFGSQSQQQGNTETLRNRYQKLKAATKQELLKNWQEMVDGNLPSKRSTWDIDLDISAPRIMFIEHFLDNHATLVVIDLGRFHFFNSVAKQRITQRDSEEEAFATPCATPPGSPQSEQIDEIPSLVSPQAGVKNLNEGLLYNMLYERYELNLNSMQVLVGRVQDNWKYYARFKGTSSLHVLDKFNISLQIEKRIVHTNDPLYPNLTLTGNLPRLVVHMNEQKVAALRTMTNLVLSQPSTPVRMTDKSTDFTNVESNEEEPEILPPPEPPNQVTRLITMQFTVHYLALEVQSRGRSVAELQVNGVKATCTKRPFDTALTLTVHSLLLVDAMQTYGRDYELLVASHKHVGMDSLSGSIRDSEPTSPISPGSPIPGDGMTSPINLEQVLTNLEHQSISPFIPIEIESPPLMFRTINSPTNVPRATSPELHDSEALITIELSIISGSCPGHNGIPLQIAAIQFNNLDVIANQETIVELLGFVQRVFPSQSKRQPPSKTPITPVEVRIKLISDEVLTKEVPTTRTEITFDFHRLNILLLRAVRTEGRKVCTATVMEASITATIAEQLIVSGSLGGIQVLDQTAEGQKHMRILSVGMDPLAKPLENVSDLEGKAFSFQICRKLGLSRTEAVEVDVKVRLASVWYTHSPKLLKELQSCATEFKQYLAKLASSIRAAAAEMAMGFVSARPEILSGKLSRFGSTVDVGSPRRRRHESISQSLDHVLFTPHSPYDDDDIGLDNIEFKMDVILESPVIVIPCSATSDDVFVARLGRITVRNCESEFINTWEPKVEKFQLEVRDMNVYSVKVTQPSSLNTSGNDTALPRPEQLYSNMRGNAVLHDTVIELTIERSLLVFPWDTEPPDPPGEPPQLIRLSGGVVNCLRISLTRRKYQQVLDTWKYIIGDDTTNESLTYNPNQKLSHIEEEESNIEDLPQKQIQDSNTISLTVNFDVPEFTIELNADLNLPQNAPLVSISFRDFMLKWDKRPCSSCLQMSLRSLIVEDLSVPDESKNRFLVVSTAASLPSLHRHKLSKSCPSLNTISALKIGSFYSLPDRFSRHRTIVKELPGRSNKCPSTPPPSPRSRRSPPCDISENLVLISINDQFTGPRTTQIDFNCLDIIVSNHSWVAVFDFFNADSKPQWNPNGQNSNLTDNSRVIPDTKVSKFELTVRSLSLVLVKPEYEVAKANISHLTLKTRTDSGGFSLEGRLGSMSILDLSPHGKFYRERFFTKGQEALNVRCKRYCLPENQADIEIYIEMSSVVYVHTQRFIMEVYSLWNHFSELQNIVAAMRNDNTIKVGPSLRVLLAVDAGSPVLVLPVSSTGSDVIVADLGNLTIRNQFLLAGSDGTISAGYGKSDVDCLLDVMSIRLVNMDLFVGRRVFNPSSNEVDIFHFGGVFIVKNGPSLLTDKCHLELQVDRNLDTYLTRAVPDVAVRGTLAKLDGTLDLSQYKLVRGLFVYNIGESLQDLTFNIPSDQPEAVVADHEISTWLSRSIQLDLVNVVVELRGKHETGSSLAKVNFIKSRLVIEIYSDRSQDIDLVSSEILLIDTRFLDEPVDKRNNVFTNILQPLESRSRTRNRSSSDNDKLDSDDGVVQAEIHHRRRKDKTKSTILVHNMRVMAVFDWWEMMRDFIGQNFELPDGLTPVTSEVDAGTSSDTHPFEFKLNVTDSEIVLVEDTSMFDTSAVILKSTTVITYRPNQVWKPLSCNLNHCEVFSCLLGMEDETALSIIDPVTVSLDIRSIDVTGGIPSRGLGDLLLTSADRTLEVSLPALSIRLSYHDFRLLSRLVNSVPKQTRRARDLTQPIQLLPANVRKHISKLLTLGFSEEDCAKALEISNNTLDDAALWLIQNAKHSTSINDSNISFDTFEIKLGGALSLVVIDDCRDADVPLLEFSLNQLNLRQNLNGSGNAKFVFMSDYYNRLLSGWEPFIESWRCNLKWNRTGLIDASRSGFHLEIQSEDFLNINITSTLLELYNMVKESWTEDYYGQTPNISRQIEPSGSLALRRRNPFVPFALKNETGCALWFTTFTKTTDNISQSLYAENEDEWMEVNPDETVPFYFEGREKVRHRDTHKIRVHQIIVRAGFWRPADPITIDRVGVFFRQAPPPSHLIKMGIPPARLVFQVTLEGCAKKLVTVRSALTLNNQLNEDIEARLVNTVNYTGAWDETLCMHIASKTLISLPLTHAHSRIWIRPLDRDSRGYHAFSSNPLGWMTVKNAGEIVYEPHQCHSNRDCSYRFVAEILRERFPESASPWLEPAHSIKLSSPVNLTNLLPCDLHYSLRHANIRGHIKPGGNANLHEVEGDTRIEINIQLDGFVRYGTLVIPNYSASGFYRSDVRLHDHTGRRLVLDVEIEIFQSVSVRITISASFWIVNKSSLAVVVKQEGSSADAAGQFEEHEVARVVSPLLFSLADSDASPLAQIRIGNGCHPAPAQPQWCLPFALQKGIAVVRLRVAQRDRPDIVYTLGVNIRNGRGRYRRTKIVTISPRYQLQNKSSLTLQFSQLYFTRTVTDPAAEATYSKAIKDCSMAWHWPRPDRPLRLCVRLPDIRDCLWSGGFAIDNDDSFQINIRDFDGKMHFIRVDIVLQNATYFTVFTDADAMPPPVRIDNLALVPIEFHQHPGVGQIDTPRTLVRAQSSIPYAWDLPQGGTILVVTAPGGSQASCNMNQIPADGPQLTLNYENFIYIAFTATFNNVFDNSNAMFEPLYLESQQLVLDCIDGHNVVLRRKQQGARSQLWRMTSSGQLQHEGTSPPREPKSKHVRQSDYCFVLDIATAAPQPSQCVPLILRRVDQRRSSTQTWRFTPDGRLMCRHNRMCVQAKDGFFGLRKGSEAVLGPCHELLLEKSRLEDIPVEHQVSRMKMRPGSGCLVVSVTSDGPSRVLRIADPMDFKLSHERDSNLQRRLVNDQDILNLQVTFKLTSGLGVSLISNKPPEELLYLQLRGVVFNFDQKFKTTSLDCSIQDIQCDNQLSRGECDVVLHVTRGQREDELQSQMPAVVISAVKQHSDNVNAHIYTHFIVHLKRLSLCLEERLLLKVAIMAGWVKDGWNDRDEGDGEEEESQKRVMEATSVHATRYYFGTLRLSTEQVRLSVTTSTKLPSNLQAAKKQLGLRLLKFEDAAVDVKEFARQHLFETWQCLINAILKHLKTELAWQAASILGSVDFLGNPLGLVNDVSEGVSGLIFEGNVGALVNSVTHGLSNSAAKLTGSLSDGLGKVIMDDSHEETRQRIRKVHSGSSGDHVLAGLKGLGFGLLGGLTSVVKQTYEGAVQEGVQGLFSGLGKGLVGSVTKPVVGVLDFASEAASAVRDSSRVSGRITRSRLPRVAAGPRGLLPPYSAHMALGQRFLLDLSSANLNEILVAYETLRSDSEDLRIIVSTENIIVFTVTSTIVFQSHLSSVFHAAAVSVEDSIGGLAHYIELNVRQEASGVRKQPRVRCDARDVADRVCQQINYGRALHEEVRSTVLSQTDHS